MVFFVLNIETVMQIKFNVVIVTFIIIRFLNVNSMIYYLNRLWSLVNYGHNSTEYISLQPKRIRFVESHVTNGGH